MKYTVLWCETKWFADIIEANSEDEAKEKWERSGEKGELYCIADENENETYYD